MEILSIALTLLGGGLAGALLNEWLRRRRDRVQRIPLIERVNRLVSPELRGLTLARLTGEGETLRLEEIKNVREYQFTLRNTSTVHLQDVEIQFEFPTEDVEGWAERPALSKTAPVPMRASVTGPWKKGYRWLIPQLPSTDSVDFTFRAVDPTSDNYEVALYKSDRVVIDRSKGEPLSTADLVGRRLLEVTAAGLAIVTTFGALSLILGDIRGKNVTSLTEAGCNLSVISSFERFNSGGWPWRGPWQLSYRLINTGPQKCVVQLDQLTGAQMVIDTAQERTQTTFSSKKPTLIQSDLSLGPEGPTHKTKVTLYGQVP